MVDHIETQQVPRWLDRQAFPFRSRFVQTRWGQVHYVDEGPRDAEPVLLVHGTPSWSFEYRHAISALARTRRVIAYDHLGFGLSERPVAFAYTPEAHAEVLRELLEALELSRFSLVVHDYGGPIALPLAAAAPERITSLVVMNSWLWRLGEDASLARGARLVASRFGRFLYRWLNASLRLLMPLGYADRRKLTPEIHAQYLAPFRARSARERVLWRLAQSLAQPSPSLDRLWQERARLSAIPALIVWGLGDRVLPPSVLVRLRAALPQARVEELRDVGHWPQEEAPLEVARLLDGFLPSARGAAS
jgi:pimeloyl-ACP methyl ester carboxylesterase